MNFTTKNICYFLFATTHALHQREEEGKEEPLQFNQILK